LSQGLAPGVYTVFIQDANGCIDSVSNIIVRDTVDYAVIGYESQTITMGESVYIYATVNSSGYNDSLVSWVQQDPSTGQLTPYLSGPGSLSGFTVDSLFTDMNYIVYLNNGCGDSSLVEIRIDQEQTIYVPNAFSPNGDGVNDVFTVYGSTDVRRVVRFMVYDRWGELVHIGEDFDPGSTDPTNGWNGVFNGKAMNPAVFVYYAEVELLNGEVVKRKGDVTLVR
jgi:gliding motility-associated-like protein